MMQSLIHIRICARQPMVWEVPLLQTFRREFPALTTFDFDNYSEESIRQYASELLKQSNQAAIVVEVDAQEAPISGLTSFFNRMLKHKPERLMMALQGEQPILQQMIQTLAGQQFYHKLPEKKLEDVLRNFFS